jgi:hypothetical protein
MPPWLPTASRLLSGEQLLEKLLALNLERAAEAAKTAKVQKPKAQQAKDAEEML